MELGRGQQLRSGKEIAILNFGSLLGRAAQVAEALDASLVDMRFVKPLDETLLAELCAGHDQLVTIEENAVAGGAGSAVNEWLAAHGLAKPVLNLGLPDDFIDQGTQNQQLASVGLDAEAMLATIKAWRGR
jgi:1-deoxy-D-xylulose-5-phosphate synthase